MIDVLEMAIGYVDVARSLSSIPSQQEDELHLLEIGMVYIQGSLLGR